MGAGTGFNAGLLGYLVGETGHVTTIDVDEGIVDGARRRPLDIVRGKLERGALPALAQRSLQRLLEEGAL
ncbi:hypothetical protein [Streptomyces sp. Tu 4128]|uniref:hypothetical protein n=1 Tax=Streptomyces sp. Tu 4128 TaxID=1120314 RepID=UPI001F11BB3C|nr:hypothetical protein [Streptomyces sp. Tu 4128]